MSEHAAVLFHDLFKRRNLGAGGFWAQANDLEILKLELPTIRATRKLNY